MTLDQGQKVKTTEAHEAQERGISHSFHWSPSAAGDLGRGSL